MSAKPHDLDPERINLARMSAPPERDLPGGRHDVLREFLMQEIDQTHEAAPTRAPALRRPRLRRMAFAGAFAAITAVAVAVGPSLLGSAATPAYAIEAGSDSVTVTLKPTSDHLDIAAFESAMAEAGVPTRLVDVDACGFDPEQVARAVTARIKGASRGDARQANEALIIRSSRDEVTFKVSKNLPSGETMVLYMSRKTEPTFPITTSEVRALADGWQPCSALS